MSKIINLLFLKLKTSLYQFCEYLRVIAKYYPQNSFYKIDLYLLYLYTFQNPFRISKRFLKSKGEADIYAYGETPLTTLEIIAKRCKLSNEDVVFELGCGRGRTCFWLRQFINCAVVGIDYVPEFITKAHQVKAKFNLQKMTFRLEDFLQTDLTEASVIYLYGTCLPDDSILLLINRFKTLSKSVKLITVSFALNEYDPHSFRIIDSFAAPFTWGEATVFIQAAN